jgi:ATP-binding cassette, subfamily C (CFTR/MRP), member 1
MVIYDDVKICDVFSLVHLESRIVGLPEKLATQVEESGSNFSVREHQLPSLARALFRDTSTLVLDETTSSVDPETDCVLQEMLNGDLLIDQTVITIAYWIETLLKSDRVLVLDHGEVAEFWATA